MTEDEERWAETLALERWKGADARRFIAERIAALTEADDLNGVERFTELARRLDLLRGGARQ